MLSEWLKRETPELQVSSIVELDRLVLKALHHKELKE